MKYFCFDIIIPGKLIDFISPNESDGTHKFHAHLYANESNIELRVFFGFNTFTPEFSMWLYNSKLEKAFAQSVVTNINKENQTQKIDFSESKIIGHSQGGNQTENGLGEYFKINLSSVRIYLNSSNNNQNSADFYMNSVGFNLVKNFHSLLFGNKGEFTISRMKGYEDFYQYENIKFRPEFEFYTSDVRNETKAFIEKRPKISLTFPKDTSETKILHCAEIARLIGSFYMHNNIEFNFARIHLDKITLLIYKSKGKEYQQSDFGLQDFGINWNFHQLMLSDWQDSANKNFKLLSKIIPLFVQSLLVDHNSSLLITYSILETCISYFNKQKGDNVNKEFEFTDKEEHWRNAINELMKSVKEEDKADFEKRWTDIQNNLKYKPMRSKLNKFLSDFKIDKLPYPVSFKKIKEMRDDLSHGSIESVNLLKLKQANFILYVILGYVILNCLGVNEQNIESIVAKANLIQ